MLLAGRGRKRWEGASGGPGQRFLRFDKESRLLLTFQIIGLGHSGCWRGWKVVGSSKRDGASYARINAAPNAVCARSGCSDVQWWICGPAPPSHEPRPLQAPDWIATARDSQPRCGLGRGYFSRLLASFDPGPASSNSFLSCSPVFGSKEPSQMAPQRLPPSTFVQHYYFDSSRPL
jgi:hypothetical protein